MRIEFVCCMTLLSGLALSAPSARGDGGINSSQSSSSARLATPVSYNPVGLGLLFGTAENSNEYRLVVEGQNHFNQRVGIYNVRQYGHGQARIELGNGAALNLAATSGITLFGLSRHSTFSPHIGIEPMSGRIALDSNRALESSYEWLPAVSAGPQFAFSSCRFLPLVRGGAGVGNLGKDGRAPSIRPTYGVGTYFNCAGMDVAAEITRLKGQANDVDLALADVAYEINSDGLKLGLRGESVQTRDLTATHSEQRVLLLLRGQLAGFN
jgi:hypothetical protein